MTKSRQSGYGTGAPLCSFAPATKTFKSVPSANRIYDSCQLAYSRSTGLPYIWTPTGGWQVIQASGSSGILPVSGGGTGIGTLTGIPLFAGTSAVTALTYVAPTSWTPNVQINGSNTGITYANQVGTWSRIANLVFINANITLTSKGVATGPVTISNLPVATGPAGTINNIPVNFSSVALTTAYTSIFGDFANSSAVMSLFEQGSPSVVTLALTNAMINDDVTFQFSGVYVIN